MAGGAPAARKPPHPWLPPAVLTGALIPLAVMIARAATENLGAEPVATALNQLGLLALIFLVASLACTPLKTLVGWTWPVRLRRMLGLLAFFYAALHVLLYAVVDQGLDLGRIVADVTTRKFIFVGVMALVLMAPLAATSTAGSVKRLGYERWKRLHRLAYLSAGLGAFHFYLRVKRDHTEPVVYASILGALLAARVVFAIRDRRRAASAATARAR